jgi:cytoskeleton protein RodZ
MTTDTTASTAANDSKDHASDNSRQGPGRLIRLARERARLQVSELAALTKLTPSTLEALERDDFNVLNEPVYVRGYYRKCAKALAIGEQELLAAYEKLVAPKAPQAPTKLLIGSGEGKTGLRSGGRGGSWGWLLWLIAIGAVIGIGLYLFEDSNARHLLSAPPAEQSSGLAKPSLAAPAAPAEQPAAPAASEPAPAPAAAQTPAAPAAETARPLSTNELSTTPAERGVSQPAAEAPAQDATPAHSGPGLALAENVAPAAPAAASSQTAAPAGPQSLVLDFKGTSWARIEDSSGKVLMSGVIQSGEHQVISGKPPYSVFLGNAPGVTVQYQGQAIDLQPYTKSNATARLSVPAGG